MGVLHGEQYLEIRRPLPAAATVVTTPRLVSIQDKGRAAVLVIAAETRVQGSAQVSTYQEITVFARGAGGFAGLTVMAGVPAKAMLACPVGGPADILDRLRGRAALAEWK